MPTLNPVENPPRCARCDALFRDPAALDAPQEALEYFELTGHFASCPAAIGGASPARLAGDAQGVR
jgi:hypothetical protein